MDAGIKARFDTYSGGIALVMVIAAAATFLSEHYGAPAMLFALLIGMAFHFLAETPGCAQGVEFSAKTLLRFGVCLLGLRLSFGDVASVGLGPVAAVIGFVLATLGCGAVLSRLLGRRMAFGLLAGGSVAICGASAVIADDGFQNARPSPIAAIPQGGNEPLVTKSTDFVPTAPCAKTIKLLNAQGASLMTGPKTLLTTVETLPWESLDNPITGKTMHRKMLHVDKDTGMEVFLVRYGPGVQTPKHTHPCSHGMFVLSGRLVTQKGLLHPGDFVWFEEGVVGEHGATDDEPTLALFITNKPFDIQFVD